MSVICKVYINVIKPLGTQHLVLTNCIAENEVMAAYNPDAEDMLFSKYSPSGSAEFVVSDATAMQMPRSLGTCQDKLYLMFVRQNDPPAFAKALCFAPLMIQSSTDFGGTSKQFDMRCPYGKKTRPDYRLVDQFAHRIMIDNPGASDQFAPGQQDWWVGVYDAGKLTMAEVVADAHA